ncbi:MAG: hypothetical protein LBT01_07095 [Spirochaetaceae bacterium]|jgi:hypothetical protein|nr:hypothetical protein [Spirochaetaceae bacterium]
MINPVSPLQIAGAGFTLSARGAHAKVPVSPAHYIYSHFKHVSGVPAPEGVQGVTVSKIKILDTLIEHLSQAKMKKNGNPKMNSINLSDKQLDKIINFLQNEIESAVAVHTAIPYTPNPLVSAGTFFNIKV